MVFNLRTFSFTESDEDGPTPPKRFSLKELRVATENFSGGNIVGGGDFGKVYRGRLADGSQVVVKRALVIDQRREEIFEREMQVASFVSIHRNVLSLRGFCRTERELLLVYPLMIHNSLASNLGELSERSTRPLDWTTRMRIALGAARGLAHLHDQGFCSSVVMHERNVQEGTIKSPVEDSVVSGSGSQTYHCYDDVYVDKLIHGVNGFIAPEYRNTGKCTLKNDIFAYGRTLLVLVSGQAPANLPPLVFGKHIIKNELKTLIDPELQGNYAEEEAEGLVRLALLCAHRDPSVRPEMSEVVRRLKSRFSQRGPSSRSSWSQSEWDSTPYYPFPPSPSPSPLGIAS
ncbi:Protein kinase domain-containing protein [Psidium guajava]|nr:Protein kinase domain-containing protein [Psidium guajava]